MSAGVEASPERSARAAWAESFFASVAPHERAKAGSDAINLIIGLSALLLTIIAFRQNPSFESWLVGTFQPPPKGISFGLSALFFVGTFGAVALLATFAVVHRDKDLSIDLVGSFVLGLGFSYGIQWLLGTEVGRPSDPALSGVNVGFPVPILSAIIAATIVGRTYVTIGVRRFMALAIGFALFGSMTTGRALPLALAGSLLVGWVCACIMRLWRGRPRVAADPTAIVIALLQLGLTNDLTIIGRSALSAEFGVDRLDAHDASGDLRVSVYGRDSRDAELLRSTWRWITLRDQRAAPFVSREQQAEHEALLTATLHQATDGLSPKLIGMATTVSARDVLVVSRPRETVTLRTLLGTSVDPSVVRGVVEVVARAHAGRMAVGTVDLDRLGVDAGVVVVNDPTDGVLNPVDSDLNRDVASAMTVMALLSNVDTAVSEAIDVVGAARVTSALSYLQRAAFTASLSRDAKAAGKLLTELQEAGAKALGVEGVELVPLRRVSGATLVLAIGTLIGGWALIAVLVNVANSMSTIKGANIAWVALTFAVAQLVFPALGLVDLGSVAGRLPYGKVIVLEVSNTFSSLAAGTVAVLAARVRFYQRQGYNATIAVSSGVLCSMVSWIVKGALFVISLPFVWSSVNISTSSSSESSSSNLARVILLAVVAIGIALGLVLFVPRWRRTAIDKLTPKYHETRDHLSLLAAQPMKLVEIFAGSIAAQLIVAAALGAALHAFDWSLPMSSLIFVLTVGSFVGGLSPVPGGMGVVEAGMILALTWVGVPDDIAVAAVFVQRLFTAYLPPIWGYVCLLWLRRHELL